MTIKQYFLFLCLIIVAFFNNAGIINTVSDANFQAATAADSFFTTDSNTVQHFSGFSSNTSVSGNSDTNTAWTVNGTDTTTSESVTCGDTKTVTTRTFDGTSGNNMTNNTSYILGNGFGSFTIEFIFKPDVQNNQDQLYSNRQLASPNTGHLGYYNASNQFYALTRNSSNAVIMDAARSSMASVVGAWTHIVVRYDDETTLRVAYQINGLVTSTAISGSGNTAMTEDATVTDNMVANPLANFMFGSGSISTWGGFDGKIAEMRISNIARY